MAGKPSLKALTTAALALPGIADAELQTDYLFAHYSEGDIAASRSADGQKARRYDIETHALRLASPLRSGTLLGSLSWESMSGASPWWVQPGADGQAVQVMSGASISEQRIDVQASYAQQNQNGLDWIASLGYSDEDDYQALSGSLELIRGGARHGLVYSGGLQFSADQLNPVRGASSPDVIAQASKDSLAGFFGVSWDAGAHTAVQAGLSLTWHDGYLSDPYKRVFIVDEANTRPDARPDQRQLWALSGKLRHYLSRFKTALRADYRYFFDDWGIHAHTVELGSHSQLGQAWQLSPSLRWTSQSQADFYAVYFDSAPDNGLVSSDYRLSPFGAVSVRLDVNRDFARARLGLGLEWYAADADYALDTVAVENPGLVDYLIINLRVSWLFGGPG